MSHVYRATDSVLGRRVAVKVLTDTALADPEARARFLQEARLASSIQHENIIAIYDFGEDAGRPFLVMEFVEGESLRSAIEAGRAGDMAERIRIARQAAKALAHIHSRKVIHRDLKPENIHIDRAGKVRLMDFGIAGAPGAGAASQGNTAGTPFYMAPEQVLGRPLTEQADIFSFGVVLYELFAGQKPFQGATAESIFEQILRQPVDPQPLIQAGVPARVIQVIQRCTAKKLMERPATLASIVEDLHSAAAAHPAAAPRDPVSTPGLLSPSSQRPESTVRLRMPEAPPPAATPAAPSSQPAAAHRALLWVAGGAIAVSIAMYAVVALTAR